MTRKMMAVSSEAIDKPKTPVEQHQPPRTLHHNGAVDKPPEVDNSTELNMDVDPPLKPPTPAGPVAASVHPSASFGGRGPPGTAGSTASRISVSHLNFLPLKTQTTLKSPLDGHNLGPFHKPEEFLQRTLDGLASPDWEANVNGMASVTRLVRHHPEYLLVEYKPLLKYVMKHVKNLRSQVLLH